MQRTNRNLLVRTAGLLQQSITKRNALRTCVSCYVAALKASGLDKRLITSRSYVLNKLTLLYEGIVREIKQIFISVCKGPTMGDYMRSRNLDRHSPEFPSKILAIDNAFLAQLIERVALVASPKVFLAWDKARVESSKSR